MLTFMSIWDPIGGPIKITASPDDPGADTCRGQERKGLTSWVLSIPWAPLCRRITPPMPKNILQELPGGLRHKNGITLIPGGELETREGAYLLPTYPI